MKVDTSISATIPDPIKRASRAFGYALWLNTSDYWLGFKTILKARLTVPERVSLAFAALKSLDPDDALETAQAALCGAGRPIPPLFSHMDEAAFWADMASRDELKAYLVACYNRLPERDQADFLAFVQREEAA